MMAIRTATVPLTFWQDHIDRRPYDDGVIPPAAVGYRGRSVTVTGDLSGLRADAEYYASDAMDECPTWLRRSAKRTLEILDKE